MSGFGTQTLIVALIAGGLTVVLSWRWSFQVLAALVLLVPFRDLSIRWMNASTTLTPDWVNAISRWWFIMILGLSTVVLVQWIRKWNKERRPIKLDALVVTFGLVILVAVVYALISSNFSAAFTSLRGYLQPMAVFVIAAAVRPTRRQLQVLLVLLFVVGIIMAAFEFWQVAGWDDDAYRTRGYIRQNGEIVSPTITVQGEDYIRPTSTVSGPNELGVDMMLLMLLALFAAFSLKNNLRLLSLGLVPVFALGIVLTFSRSSMLGMAAAVSACLLLLIKKGGQAGDRTSRKIPRGFLLAGAGLATVLLAIMILTGAFQFLGRTVANLTSEFHFVDSLDAAQYLLKHPSGVGMGMVEPKGALVLIETEALYHVEGSLFQIAMEMGVWGLALWILFWAVCLVTLWRRWTYLDDPFRRVWSGTAITAWIGSLIAFLFLPLMQSISLMVWLWFLLGLALRFDPAPSAAEDGPIADAGVLVN